jgi:hypothetical protein
MTSSASTSVLDLVIFFIGRREMLNSLEIGVSLLHSSISSMSARDDGDLLLWGRGLRS